MLSFESTSTISASPAAVWAVLTDGAAWPSGDSGVANVDGTIAPGKKLTIQSSQSKGTSAVLTIREEYSGPLAGSNGKSIPDPNPFFAQFAHGLEARVEGGK